MPLFICVGEGNFSPDEKTKNHVSPDKEMINLEKLEVYVDYGILGLSFFPLSYNIESGREDFCYRQVSRKHGDYYEKETVDWSGRSFIAGRCFVWNIGLSEKNYAESSYKRGLSGEGRRCFLLSGRN